MILFELNAIVLNFLFGLFFYISLNTISFYEVKIKYKLIINLLYFLSTLFCGIIYIIYIDSIFFSFNYYYILFIVLGFYFVYSSKYFKIRKRLPLFNYLFLKTLNIIKKVFLFLINYNFWKKLKQIIKKKE